MRIEKELFPATVDGVNYLIDKDAPLKDSIITDGIELFYPSAQRNDALTKEFQEHLKNKRSVYKVIAVEYPHKVDGLYQYKLPDEVVHPLDMAVESSLKFYKQPFGYDAQKAQQGFVLGFTEGYKAHKAKWNNEEIESIEVEMIVDLKSAYYDKTSVLSIPSDPGHPIYATKYLETYKLTPEGLLQIEVKYKS